MQPKHKAINNAGAYLCSGIYKYQFKFIFTTSHSIYCVLSVQQQLD